MLSRWEERWENLQLSKFYVSYTCIDDNEINMNCDLNKTSCFIIVLEVYQFARDAAVAEAWLIAQEPYLMSMELGVSLNLCIAVECKFYFFLQIYLLRIMQLTLTNF